MVDGTAITHLSRGHHYQSGDHEDVIAQQSKDAIIYVTVSRNHFLLQVGWIGPLPFIDFCPSSLYHTITSYKDTTSSEGVAAFMKGYNQN